MKICRFSLCACCALLWAGCHSGSGPIDHHLLGEDFFITSIDAWQKDLSEGYGCENDSLIADPLGGHKALEPRLPGPHGFVLDLSMIHRTYFMGESSDSLPQPANGLYLRLNVSNFDLHWLQPGEVGNCLAETATGTLVSADQTFVPSEDFGTHVAQSWIDGDQNLQCVPAEEPFYLGFRYDPGRGKDPHFGLMRMEWDNCRKGVQLLEYAIQKTPLTPIVVGDSGQDTET